MRDMLADSLSALLRDHVDARALEAIDRGEWPARLWAALEDNGFTCALGPEPLGGASWEEAFVIAHLAGKAPAPAPLTDTMMANWLMGACGVDPASGSVVLAFDHTLALTSNKASGLVNAAPWGAFAARVVAVCGRTLIVLDRADAQLTPGRSIAGEPRDSLVFRGASVVAAASLPDHLPDDIALLVGAMARAAQISGALESVLETSATYARDRTQFGRPIAVFQAVQHQIALCAEHTVAAKTIADAAFSGADRDFSEMLIAAAKVVAGEAAGVGANVAHAVHGAIGFTKEHTLHHSTRRLWSWRTECGGAQYWAQRMGKTICANEGDMLWRHITRNDALLRDGGPDAYRTS